MEKPFSCEWEIIHVCNYRCPYCPYPWEDAELAQRHKACSNDDWIKFWRQLFETHGTFRVGLTGGEPGLRRDLPELLEEISRWHRFEMTTNLSWDVRSVAGRIPTDRIVFYPTFHPHFVEVEEFLEKAALLRRTGYRVVARMVAYPPLFGDLPGFKRRFEEAGILARFNAFFGEYNGRMYPEAYSPQERVWLREQTNIAEKPYSINLALESPRGRLCESGARYFRVYPNGDVYRCAPVVEMKRVLGNIRDPGFSLKAEASACPADRCFCLTEYMYLKDFAQSDLFKPADTSRDVRTGL